MSSDNGLKGTDEKSVEIRETIRGLFEDFWLEKIFEALINDPNKTTTYNALVNSRIVSKTVAAKHLVELEKLNIVTSRRMSRGRQVFGIGEMYYSLADSAERRYAVSYYRRKNRSSSNSSSQIPFNQLTYEKQNK